MEVVKRVCLLTGASGVLGTAFIERYADRYQIVAVHHRNAVQFATQEQTFVDPLLPSRAVEANALAVLAFRADLSKPGDIDQLIALVLAQVGGIDLLINAAAVRSWSPLLANGGQDESELVFRVNVLAPLRLSLGLAQAFWRVDPDANMQFNRNIVNVSSIAGQFVYPDLGQALYASSKAALNHLTYHMASEFWDIGVRVNAVAPNTFPGLVPTCEVLEAIVALDAGLQTGELLSLPGLTP